MKKMMEEINKKLLVLKGHYFLWNAGTGAVVPYVSTYAKQLGFSSSIVGLMYTVMPIMGMLAKPLFGAIADRFRCQKAIFLTFILVTAASFLAVFYSPTIPGVRQIHFACDNSITALDTCSYNISVSECAMESLQSTFEQNNTIRCDLNCAMTDQNWNTVCNNWSLSSTYCNEVSGSDNFAFQVDLTKSDYIADCAYFRVGNAIFENGEEHYPNCMTSETAMFTSCKITCDSNLLNEIVTQTEFTDQQLYSTHEFWLLFLFMIIFWVGQAIVVSVTDAVCFEMLDNHPEKYGVQRCFGALGWGISAVIAGFMMDAFSSDLVTLFKDYTSIFYLGFALLILDFILSYKLNYTQKKISTNILRDVGKLLGNARILIFMVFCTWIGMCTGLIWNFFFWLVEDLATQQEGCDSTNWIKTLEGLLMAVQCLLGELPFFFLSGWILKRIGHVNAMSLILSVIGIRYILYSIIRNPWWFLPIELTNGITFGLFYASMASYASIVAPTGTETTVQGLVGAIFEGVGVSLGSLTAGTMFEVYGGIMTFRIFGIVSLGLCLLHAAIHFLLDKFFKGKDDTNYNNRKKDVDLNVNK